MQRTNPPYHDGHRLLQGCFVGDCQQSSAGPDAQVLGRAPAHAAFNMLQTPLAVDQVGEVTRAQRSVARQPAVGCGVARQTCARRRRTHVLRAKVCTPSIVVTALQHILFTSRASVPRTTAVTHRIGCTAGASTAVLAR